MDIREFVFRHMQGTRTGRFSSVKSNSKEVERDRSLRMATIVNDPECREMCARFLYTEIFLGGLIPTDYVYDQNYWEPMAEYFINNIVPSAEFMHDCIQFFADIREGRGEKYVS